MKNRLRMLCQIVRDPRSLSELVDARVCRVGWREKCAAALHSRHNLLSRQNTLPALASDAELDRARETDFWILSAVQASDEHFFLDQPFQVHAKDDGTCSITDELKSYSIHQRNQQTRQVISAQQGTANTDTSPGHDLGSEKSGEGTNERCMASASLACEIRCCQTLTKLDTLTA